MGLVGRGFLPPLALGEFERCVGGREEFKRGLGFVWCGRYIWCSWWAMATSWWGWDVSCGSAVVGLVTSFGTWALRAWLVRASLLAWAAAAAVLACTQPLLAARAEAW